jgi:hypothetical protein
LKNDIPEPLENVQLVPRSALRVKVAASLKPDARMMEAAAFGQPEACAIRDAWRFRQNRATRIITVSRDEFAAMIDRQVVFDGK